MPPDGVPQYAPLAPFVDWLLAAAILIAIWTAGGYLIKRHQRRYPPRIWRQDPSVMAASIQRRREADERAEGRGDQEYSALDKAQHDLYWPKKG